MSAVGTDAVITLTGNDISGTITVKTGATPSIGSLLKLIFVNPYGSAPRVLITPVGNISASLAYNVGSSSTTSFTPSSGNIPQPLTTYTFNYWVVQ